MESIQIRPKTAADVEWLESFLKVQSNEVQLQTFFGEMSLLSLPAWIADVDGEPVGLLVYYYESHVCHIVCLRVSRKRMGVGESLLNQLENEAKATSCKKMTCIIGNDNLNALRFLQKRGFQLALLRVGAIEERRRKDPTIQLTGEYGIPLRDELMLERALTKAD